MDDSVFDHFFGAFFRTKPRNRPQTADRRVNIDELTNNYLRNLTNRGDLTPEQVRQELCAVFKYIRAECEAFGRGKRHIEMNILRILKALDEGITAKRGEYLLAKWKGWEDMLNPGSPRYIGINLPGTMIIENYVVFEDLIPIREYFGKHYSDGSFDKKVATS
jgi:hypothetical protein